jgi:tol-pal system protein YbgF
VLSASGCGSVGVSDDLEMVIIDTQKRVRKLNDELGSSVEKLNSTTSELYARVNAAEESSMRLQNVVEENQGRLDQLSKDLAKFRDTLYRHFNLSTGGAGAVAQPPVSIEPPAYATPLPTGDYTVDPANTNLPPAAPVAPGAAAAPAAPAGQDPVELYTKAQRTFASSQDNPALIPQAIQEFDAFLAQYPDTSRLSANAYFWKGKCYLNLSQYENAIQTFEGLRTKFPSEDKVPFAMQNQAVAHNALGQSTQAMTLLEQVIANYPASPVAEQAKIDLQKLKGN